MAIRVIPHRAASGNKKKQLSFTTIKYREQIRDSSSGKKENLFCDECM